MSSNMFFLYIFPGQLAFLHELFCWEEQQILQAWLPGSQETLWMAIGLLPANRWSVNSLSSLQRARSPRFLKGMSLSWKENRKYLLSSWKINRKATSGVNACMVEDTCPFPLPPKWFFQMISCNSQVISEWAIRSFVRFAVGHLEVAIG